jgi:hypothetical protein
MPERTTKQIAAKEQAYQNFLISAKESPLRHAADMLLGAFLIDKNFNNKASIPTTASVVLELLGENSNAQQQKRALATQACQKGFVLHWPLAFPQVFAQGGFDCVLGNPPWERIKLQEEEFFASRNPNIAQAKNKAERSQRIQWLSEGKLAEHLYPSLQHSEVERQAEQTLFEELVTAKRTAEAASVFFHVKGDEGGRYSLTGIGDVNTYALFSESILEMTSIEGRAGFIVPTGIATDDSTKTFFGYISQNRRLASLFDFENRHGIFPSVHRSFKFSLLTLGKQDEITFVCFANKVSDIYDLNKRFKLSPQDFNLINPNTLTCPIFRTKYDAELTKKFYRCSPVLLNHNTVDGDPWNITFSAMIHMAGDSELFIEEEESNTLRLYEAKMISQYNHRYASYESRVDDRGNRVLPETSLENYNDPKYTIKPYYWIKSEEVSKRLAGKWERSWLLGFKDVTTTITSRTFVSTVIPLSAVGNTMPLIFPKVNDIKLVACFLANCNSLVLDYIARQKIGYIHLTFNYLKQFPILPPNRYSTYELLFIVPRVIELTYTAYDLQDWAKDLDYNGPPFTYDPWRRALLRAELDAFFAKLYGLNRDELRYILDPANLMGEDYPSETFRVLKNSEIKEFGEYRTQRLVLEAWDKLERGELV